MTSVVYDGKTLAADSRITNTSGHVRKHTCTSCGDHTEVVSDEAQKLHVNNDGKWTFRGEKIIGLAAAGASVFIGKIVDAIKSKEDIELIYKNYKVIDGTGGYSASFLIVTEKKVYKLATNNKAFDVEIFERNEFVAIGSGSKAAEMAFKLTNASAVELINMAMSVDDMTGGKIHYVDCTQETLSLKTFSPLKPDEAIKKQKAKQPTAVKKVTPTKTTQEKKVVKAKQPEVKKTVTRLQPKSTNTARLPSFPTRV